VLTAVLKGGLDELATRSSWAADITGKLTLERGGRRELATR
jgi:hypothetical protein